MRLATPVAVPVYTGTDKVEGTLSLTLPQGKKLDHLGIKVELIGRVEMFYDRGGGESRSSAASALCKP